MVAVGRCGVLLVVALTLGAASGFGCTAVRLKNGVMSQARTLTELQYTQVLSNLAMFTTNIDAVPSQVSLHDGSTQIGDSGLASLFFDIDGGFVSHPGVSGSRTVVQQWGINPVTDDTTLKLLQIAYQRACGQAWDLAISGPGSQDPNDFANTLAHELKNQVSPVDADLRFRNELFAKERIEEAFNAAKAALPQPPPPPKSDAEYEKLLKELGQMKGKGDQPIETQAKSLVDRTQEFYEQTVISTNDEYLILPEEDIRSDNWDIGVAGKSLRPSPNVKEVRRLVKEVEQDLLAIPAGWFHVGCRRDVPANACYVGRCGNQYAWVLADGRQALSDFTLKILSFSSLLLERQVVTTPGGPRYSPAYSQQAPRFAF